MAAPQDSPEQGFRLRKFQGVQTEMDSTFIGPNFLVAAENWIPTFSYRIGKRPGSAVVQALGSVTVTSLLATHAPNGVLYLYAYVTFPGGGNAKVYLMQDEGAPLESPPSAHFGSATARGRLIAFRDRVFCGNGVDALQEWKLGDPGNLTIQYLGLAVTDLTGWKVEAHDNPAGAPTQAAMPTGNYQCCFAVFNTTTGVYISRGVPFTAADGTSGVTITNGANNTGQTLFVQAPTLVLGAPLVYRFFIAPRNFPIEYATAQGADWAAAANRTFSSIDVSKLAVPQAAGVNVFRTGNMFLVWNNRLVFAGSQADPFSVFATDVILLGLEQQAFNQGTLFPDFAKVTLPGVVTGIGVAGVTAEFDATAPLLLFTKDRTFLVQGDPFDPNGQSEMVEVSSRVGCVGHDSIVNTPVGTLWCGLDSVYMMPPGGGFPIDIGWPIANQIRQMPSGARATIVATFNKQFYKLYIPPAGGSTNVVGWWLDLRGGIGSTPSWWGPQSGLPVTALASDPASNFEIDRQYAAVPGTSDTVVLRTHQLGLFTDAIPDSPYPMPIRSRIISGRFDGEQPFAIKVFTRLRLISQSAGITWLHVLLTTDGGVTWPIDPIALGVGFIPQGQFVHTRTPTPPPLPINAFNTLTKRGFARFTSISPVEAQTITPYERPRGLAVQVMLTHDPALDAAAAPTNAQPFFGSIELRDFELLFIPSGRKVRFLNERVSK